MPCPLKFTPRKSFNCFGHQETIAGSITKGRVETGWIGCDRETIGRGLGVLECDKVRGINTWGEGRDRADR